MPLIKTFDIDVKTKLYLWMWRRAHWFAASGRTHTPTTRKFECHSQWERQKELPCYTRIAQNIGYTPTALFYDPNGKPFLSDGKQISISHSFNKVAVIISDRKVGVDIEKKRQKNSSYST